LFTGNRNIENVDGLFHHNAARDVNVGAVFCKRGIQSCEGITLEIEVLPKMRFDPIGAAAELVSHAADLHSYRQLADVGKLARKMAVDKNERATETRDPKVFELLGTDQDLWRRLKFRVRNGSYVSETPVLIVGGGKSSFCKAGEAL